MRLPRAIETPRLRLRPPTEDDLEPLFVLYSDPEVVRYLSFRPLRERGQVRAMLERFVRAWRQGEGDLTLEGRTYLYLLERPATGVLGTLGVRKETYGYELSYALARAAWGHGYMPEAVRAVADGLLARGAWRVFATCHVENVGSQRTLEKAGFEREGRMRRYFIFPNLGPEPADGYLYARVREG
ncbi:GNAT family N-acetyltransferase [Oceanithermus sp.]